MNFEYNKITQAQNRPMTPKESFGLLLFIFKFFFSKFGIFLFFFFLNIFPSFLNIGSRSVPLQKPSLSQTTSRTYFPFLDSENQKETSKGLLPSDSSLGKIQKDLGPGAKPTSQSSKAFIADQVLEAELPKLGIGLSTQLTNQFLKEKLSQDFQKLKKYCIIATIVSLFLNPQQTKYFGGLAVVLKQAGFFSKYSKSEKTVYILSWIFILVFFSNSYYLAFEFTRKI
jgi:hypothetical protein